MLIESHDDGTLARGRTIRHHVKPFPGANLEPASLAVNGIDPDHPLRLAIDESEALKDVFGEIRRAVKDANCSRAILVGHNSAFDLSFVNEAVERASIKRNPFHPFSSFDTGDAVRSDIRAKPFYQGRFRLLDCHGTNPRRILLPMTQKLRGYFL